MTASLSVGWIGLGKMGDPMSLNLMKAGFPLTVWNRSVEKTKTVAAAGAKVAGSIQELARNVDVVISMISDDPVLESVAKEVFAAKGKAKIFIDMSTVSPIASGRVAEQAKASGVNYLRAPVSGSTVLAASGKLTILVSGPKDAFETCQGLFGAMGQKVFHVGEGDEARYLKLVLNMMVGLTSAMVGEALTFGKKGGMGWEQMIDVVNASVVASPLVAYKAQMLKDRNFAPAFTAAQMAKDFDIALETAKANHVAMPMTSLMRQFLGSMMAKGKAEMDFFGYLTVLEDLANMK